MGTANSGEPHQSRTSHRLSYDIKHMNSKRYCSTHEPISGVETMSQERSVAIIDDDESTREALEDLLDSYGLPSHSFQSADQFLSDLRRTGVCCLLLDVNMPGCSGIELQAELAKDPNPPAIIFVTSYQDTRTRTAAMRAGAVAFLAKPVDVSLLIAALETVLHERIV